MIRIKAVIWDEAMEKDSKINAMPKKHKLIFGKLKWWVLGSSFEIFLTNIPAQNKPITVTKKIDLQPNESAIMPAISGDKESPA